MPVDVQANLPDDDSDRKKKELIDLQNQAARSSNNDFLGLDSIKSLNGPERNGPDKQN